MEDLKAHAQNRTVTVETPTGPVTMLAPGFLIDGAVPELGHVPALGEDTDRVREEFADAAAGRAAGR